MGMVERIKQLCKAENTTIKALEREIDISNGSIRHWDDKPPAVERVLLVANKFNVSLDWLVTGKEPNDLTPEEKNLIDLYRRNDETGKKYIMTIANAGCQEQQSSTSKLG